MTRNILNEGRIFINTITGGDAINISSTNSTSSTANVKISKQTAKTTPVNTDLFLLEESDGSIKKITYQNLEANIDTNYWNEENDILRPLYTTSSVLVGATTMNVNDFKFQVEGNTFLKGDLELQLDKKIISNNNSADYLQFGNRTFTNNYFSNVFTYGISFGATADINLSPGRAITRETDSTDRITFNSGNFTFGNKGIFNNSVFCKATDTSNSGNVKFFEASTNGTDGISLHCPFSLSHGYNAFLPQITDTNITDVYVLSNRNVLGGTNLNISNSTTDTITVNLDTTISGLTSITSTNAILDGLTVNTNPIEVKGTNSTVGYINLYDNGLTNHISLQTATSLGNSFDLILPSISDTLVSKNSTDTLTSKTLKLPKILDTSDNHNYIFGVSELTADRTITLPLLTGNDIFVFESHSQTLTNKTINSSSATLSALTVNNNIEVKGVLNGRGYINFYDEGTIKHISLLSETAIGGANNSYNLILPSISDTLITKTSTDTLTNKTLQLATFDSVPTINATIRLNGASGIAGEIDIYDIDGSNYIAIKSQDSLTGNNVLTLPAITDTLITKTSNDTLTNKTLSSTTNTITQFTGNASSTITTPSSNGTLALSSDIDTGIASATNVATQSDLSNTTRNFGNASCIANINGTSLSVPTSINTTPSGLSEGILIQYDSGLGGGNGSMIFGTNSSSASNGWDTGIYAKQFINMKCGTTNILQLNNTPGNVSSATFNTNDITINIDSNNSYQNISYSNSEPLMLLNTASSGTVHSHLVMKKSSSQTDYVILRQNDSGELLVHFENSGDRFKFSKNWEYGHAYAMWYYDNSAFTYFRNPSGTNSANSFAGSYFAFHNNGSAIYSNLPSAGTSSGDYHSFATGGNQFARMDATGSGKITGSWTGSWEGTSDRRLKKNIIPLTKAKETLMKINVYEFDKYDIVNYNTIHSETEKDKLKPFKERLSENSRKVYGFIAQELCENTEELGKMCVDTNNWGDEEPAYIIDDRPMLACAIKTIQEQQEQIDNLTALVQNQQLVINNLLSATTFANFKKM